jgi:hypothetical protein
LAQVSRNASEQKTTAPEDCGQGEMPSMHDERCDTGNKTMQQLRSAKASAEESGSPSRFSVKRSLRRRVGFRLASGVVCVNKILLSIAHRLIKWAQQ